MKNNRSEFLVSVVLVVVLLIGVGAYSFFSKIGPDYVAGILGGVHVHIPKKYVYFLEYNGDPGAFDKNRILNNAERPANEVIRSFGFQVGYPELEPISPSDYSLISVGDDNVLRVGVFSGELYGSTANNWLEGLKEFYLISPPSCDKKKYCIRYVAMANSESNLIGFAPIEEGVDVKKGRPRASMTNAEDIFLNSRNGRLTTMIFCGRPPLKALYCKQYFVMSNGMRIRVSVSYPKKYLSNWSDIQIKISEKILSFEARARRSP